MHQAIQLRVTQQFQALARVRSLAAAKNGLKIEVLPAASELPIGLHEPHQILSRLEPSYVECVRAVDGQFPDAVWFVDDPAVGLKNSGSKPS